MVIDTWLLQWLVLHLIVACVAVLNCAGQVGLFRLSMHCFNPAFILQCFESAAADRLHRSWLDGDSWPMI